MRLSECYVPTMKDVSSDVIVASHRYSLRAGLVRQNASGLYTWLPLGLKVLRGIERIVREEMDSSGFLEILMPSVQPAELWRESQRYDSYGLEMLRMQDRSGREMVFGPTHEESISDVVRSSLKSYRDLPISLYQMQWKFRDELRPRHGIMRCREFLMKDAYSFDVDFESAMRSYSNVFSAYLRIFRRLGLVAIAAKADSGAIGGSTSHEFHVLVPTGESTVYHDRKALDISRKSDCSMEDVTGVYAATEDAHDPQNCGVHPDDLQVSKGIEVAHVFYLGDRYSAPMNVKFHDKSGNSNNALMGCYGIGISRLVAAIIEVFHDDVGIRWPESIAPFRVGIVNLLATNGDCKTTAETIYTALADSSLYDDSADSPGVKLARMDLLGMPWQVIIGNSFVKDKVVELKNRASGVTEKCTVGSLIARMHA
ncbi:prolyl-tRNA synthetase [Anaplasma centrale str. Israel]|uniref:Proline--tRNA ligase n=1 Tax=Anaplasma centrale (strain Israel) TaxID=574556 RepID=D1AS88_ANACI|nr:proline--tRNA ligase [Anaplasma centrale]ACZ49341.1 prolyl-tRNA synthetase [Anaplasma centrale str. Israel]